MIASDLLGTAASVAYGSADFLGGAAARRASALTVTFVSSIAALLPLVVVAWMVGGVMGPRDAMWGVLGGIAGGSGVALLYRAFAIGPVSLASPIIGVVGLSLPVIVGLALGEHPSALALAGVALALLAIPLLARASHPDRGAVRSGVVVMSLASGLLVGAFLVCVGRMSPAAGLWPLVVSRSVTFVQFGGWLAITRGAWWPSASWRSTIGAGVMDSTANVLYLLAVQAGSLALIGALVGLAPATTVLLARFVLREHWSVPQRFGLAVALAAILCISLG